MTATTCVLGHFIYVKTTLVWTIYVRTVAFTCSSADEEGGAAEVSAPSPQLGDA